MTKTTIQIKTIDKQKLNAYMVKHGLKKSHEAFSKLISNTELISSEAAREETYKQPLEVISSSKIDITPISEVMEKHKETLDAMISDTNKELREHQTLKDRLRRRLPIVSSKVDDLEKSIIEHRNKVLNGE